MKTTLFLTIALSCFSIATVATPAFALDQPSTEQTLPSLSADELRQMMNQHQDFVLLDVRTPAEYAEGHIDNATLIPLQDLPNRVSELPKNKTIVVYCRSGRRSAQAMAFLQSNGYPKVLNLTGGINEWNKR